MNVYMAILHLIHILSGIYWLGMLWFMTLWFLPRVKSLGQERGRIMQAIMAPPFPSYMSIAGAFTVLSGILMYWGISRGFSLEWIATPPGVVLSIASLLGIYVAVDGFLVMRPTGMRIAELGRQAGAASPPNRDVIEEMQTLSSRLERSVYRGAYILTLTAIGMAVFGSL